MTLASEEEKSLHQHWTVDDWYQALQAEQRLSAGLRFDLHKARKEIEHLQEMVQRLERRRFVPCNEKQVTERDPDDEATLQVQPEVQKDSFQEQAKTVAHGSATEVATTSQAAESKASEQDAAISTASKGSYVRAADKVYWVSYEDPLQLIRLPSAEPGPCSRARNASQPDAAIAVTSRSAAPVEGREEVLLPGTPERRPRLTRPVSVDRSCFSARAKLQGHAFAPFQACAMPINARCRRVGMPHHVHAQPVYPMPWQKTASIQRRATSTSSVQVGANVLPRQRSGSLQRSVQCLHPVDNCPAQPATVCYRPWMPTTPSLLRTCSSSKSFGLEAELQPFGRMVP
mmetsp:Transcript_43801/g.102225  ORF Transcript_43801/g.102225 Transcript_43801/m.102225 type:complete len:344 (+) Transcript_43801:60-1091(+)